MRFVITLMCCIWIVGCDSVDPRLHEIDDYRSRIFSLLEIEETLVSVNTSPYPDKRFMLASIERVEINWSEFFSSINCDDLQTVIAEKNSPLGRTREAATQLYFELKTLKLLTQCEHSLSQKSPEWVSAIRIKKENMKHVVWNLTWASNYWRGLFSFSQRDNQVSQNSVNHVVAELELLNRFISNERLPEKAQWFNVFQSIESHRAVFGSAIYEGLGHLAYMISLNEALALHQQAICPQNIPTRQFDYLTNVLTKFYTTKVQREQVELIDALKAVENYIETNMFNSIDNNKLNEWLALHKIHSSPKLSEQLTNRIREHVTLWQAIMKSCGSSLRKLNE
ncbi:DUF3080 family protein [Pleionea sediminis]|uniref:DUF3080 family protein n=1 Tax=Pleionea sediminis TaxID=2569479 RepID=UPI001185B241|nr:DUF3080 family protein [Pleionea sediminis]